MTTQRRTLVQMFMTMIICAALSSYAFAQDIEKGTLEATGLVGLVSGIGTHTVVGVGVGTAVRDRILVSGELSYIPLGSGSIDVLGVQSKFSAKAITFNFDAQYQLKRSGKLKPYLGVGVGLLHSTSSSSVTTTFQGLNLSGGSSGTDAYFSVGGGARYYVNKQWGFKPEVMIFAGSATFVRLSGGIFYQFGK